MPLAMILMELCKVVKSYWEVDWMMEGPGRVFFIKPDGMVKSFMWGCYITQSCFIGQFFLCGTSDNAIQHTWYDTILTKNFWRKTLTEVDARLPRDLAHWDGKGNLTLNYPDLMCKGDIVIKINDSYLGIGDAFMSLGKDYKTVEDIRAKLSEDTYKGKEALVLELVRPKKSLGVHSFDIITMRTPDDDVKVISILLWTDCTTQSSHST